jgi:hypothetical protein
MLSGTAFAGEADVIDVKVRSAGGGAYDFDVTIRSNDTGWEHYADAFEVLAPDGTLLGQRILLHPMSGSSLSRATSTESRCPRGSRR